MSAIPHLLDIVPSDPFEFHSPHLSAHRPSCRGLSSQHRRLVSPHPSFPDLTSDVFYPVRQGYVRGISSSSFRLSPATSACLTTSFGEQMSSPTTRRWTPWRPTAARTRATTTASWTSSATRSSPSPRLMAWTTPTTTGPAMVATSAHQSVSISKASCPTIAATIRSSSFQLGSGCVQKGAEERFVCASDLINNFVLL